MRTAHVNIVYQDEVASWRETVRPRYLFVGARRVYDDPEAHRLEQLLGASDRYQLLHRAGDAAVFSVSEP